MDNYGSDLLEQTVRFIEYCQEKFASGEISSDKYNSLTAIKIDFINALINDRSLSMENDIIERGRKLILCHGRIMDSFSNCAGK